jgi:hypothetical protein
LSYFLRTNKEFFNAVPMKAHEQNHGNPFGATARSGPQPHHSGGL